RRAGWRPGRRRRGCGPRRYRLSSSGLVQVAATLAEPLDEYPECAIETTRVHLAFVRSRARRLNRSHNHHAARGATRPTRDAAWLMSAGLPLTRHQSVEPLLAVPDPHQPHRRQPDRRGNAPEMAVASLANFELQPGIRHGLAEPHRGITRPQRWRLDQRRGG